ncbi:hypothetical protein SAMN05421682_115106 [Chryseobacterium indoltheticum]|uniref:Uncharacterized protein n=1 Tax=Chryseobacterium indoltheticum TaxID=254 RepID=A0A381FAK5_9FLAO|nr:hypothetical protein SAMN05421682_115106 [Chryseobacterium indoltheticum]SUX43484.1 Uncharacterised protein [Chryseobacterium indoltheticum]
MKNITVRLFKTIYTLPLYPLYVLIALSYFIKSDFRYTGKVDEDFKNQILEAKWYFRILGFLFWIYIILKYILCLI